jgi:carboxylesterase
LISDHSFKFQGDNGRGMLLIHGLTGTPMEMRLLGKGMHAAGFTVHGVQLAGHCGTVEDLLKTGWEDWYASVVSAARALRQEVDQLFVGGLSMGALLALLLATDPSNQVEGVGVYGATFRYDGWAVPWQARLTFMLPWLKRLGLGRSGLFMEQPPYGLRDETLRAQISAAMLGGDSGAAGLPGNPWYSLAELYELSRRVRGLLPKVTVPCLIAHATEDDIASLRNARLVQEHVSGPTQMLLLENSYHMITIDRERRMLSKASAKFFSEIPASATALTPAA